MEKWLDAYSKWPPVNQLLFSCVVVASALLFLLMFGLWFLQVIRTIDAANANAKVKPATKPLDRTFDDWKKRAQEDYEYQAELQAKYLAAQGDQLKGPEKKEEIPCTPEAAPVHTSKGDAKVKDV